MQVEKTDFDVAIIGGGPAGSSMACYLARAGIRCTVLERELFPRPHVGESLVPSSNRVFKDLDLFGKMEAHRFPRKFGAVWTTTNSSHAHEHDWAGLEPTGPDDAAAVRFDERPQPGVDRPYTYHVDRGAFDLMLLKHANELGADVYEGVTVQGVDFSGSHPLVKFQLGRRQLGVSAGLVVDASGRQTVLGTQLKLKVKDPIFDQYAIHAWFEGFDRSLLVDHKEQADYIFVHFLPITNTWVWQIPISADTTSIGVVTQKKNFAKTRQGREEFFWKCVSTQPRLLEGLERAQQVRPFKEEGDYSYAMTQICGDGFLLLGDAARFVDPIFSTGVSIALNSSRFASQDVIRAAERGSFAAKDFATFDATIRRGVRNWYEFISVYYRLNVLFTYYIRDPRYRLDVLKLLQGDVYDEGEPRVLVEMRKMVSGIESRPEHPWHRLLNDLTHYHFRPQL